MRTPNRVLGAFLLASIVAPLFGVSMLLAAPLAITPSAEPDLNETVALLPSDYRHRVVQQLSLAGENKAKLLEAIIAARAEHRAGIGFLIANMPERDLAALGKDFLVNNVALAYDTRAKAPWAAAVPEEIFLDAVLPYANLNERRDDWRKDFADRFAPLVKDTKSAGDAAQILNREIFKVLNVSYHASKRRKPDQSPYESTEIGFASCSGLSILLADACRAVGVPARVVGTPMWSDKTGNHTWVEIWDGQWRFVGAAEPGKFNDTWFVGPAAKADASRPEHRIYAASFRQTDTPFILTWAPNRTDVPAVDVTSYYKHRQKLAAKVLNEDGSPVAAEISLIHNNRLIGFSAAQSAEFEVGAGESYTVRASVKGKSAEHVVQLPADADAAVELRIGQPAPTATATTPSNSPTIAALQSWLTKPAADRGALAAQPFAVTALSKSEAADARKLLWQDHVSTLRATRESEWKSNEVSAAGKTMKFLRRNFGDKPAAGWDLYISMHGGGNAPADVNDRQWQNQIKLYQPPNSLYIAPRAPTNTWNLWHEPHIDALFDRLIQDAIVFEGVNPDRVYLMGYSAGGDGVFQLAPRMADRLAAASMMAGHPNDASPLGLRNIGFTIHMGALDRAYDRNTIPEKWKTLLDDLQKDDPMGYIHAVKLHEGKPHWMDLDDSVAVPWMARFNRQPLPDRVVWKQSSVTHDRFYWLAMPPDQAKKDQLVIARRKGQSITIEKAEDAAAITILLNDDMADLDKPVTVSMDGMELFKAIVPRTIETVWQSLVEYGDPNLVFSGSTVVSIEHSKVNEKPASGNEPKAGE